MKKEIVVHVVGTVKQKGVQDDTIEIYTTGTYYEKEGKQYLFYEEDMGESYGSVQNTIKIQETPLQIVVSKKGVTNSRMVFEKGAKNESFYQTPFGGMSLSTITRNIAVKKDEETLMIDMNYDLEVNYEVFSENKIVIEGKFL
jgi:uncharacterized beta-barrel protein YwiB (DUF1934 family)